MKSQWNPCGRRLAPRFFVGASLLAKNPQAPRTFRKHALSLTFFASKLAPTEADVRLTDWH
ncbi:hypothetical protein F6S08_18050 [Pseudomonas sp. JV449]|nr:hypothetical protein [Pseudomonas sp. JV449]TKJ79107.1 hypothetical protein PspCFBP13509_14180 [Pseudomonas sp. CFBP13509]